MIPQRFHYRGSDDFAPEDLLDFNSDLVVEIIGEAGKIPDHNLIKEAVSTVLYFLRVEKKQDKFSPDEFAVLLETVLEEFGYVLKVNVKKEGQKFDNAELISINMDDLAEQAGSFYELQFFQALRSTLVENLEQKPRLLFFYGLRSCVKKLVGVHRWNRRCDELNDEIVAFMEENFVRRARTSDCALLIK